MARNDNERKEKKRNDKKRKEKKRKKKFVDHKICEKAYIGFDESNFEICRQFNLERSFLLYLRSSDNKTESGLIIKYLI